MEDKGSSVDFYADAAMTEVTCAEACTNNVACQSYQWDATGTACNLSNGVSSETMEGMRQCIKRKQNI